jgi:SepF-like predicted cell division protein (DUF552 family)
MDIKKLEKLENIRNFLENDNITALSRYVEKITPLVKKDDDFTEIFEELKNKNYDHALLITEDIIFEMKGQSRDDEDYEDLEEFEEDDDFIYNGKDDDFGDLGIGPFDDGNYFEDKDDDYF